ncbi:uncharacterized protein LOC130621385 [Hydractinia symbiolongicarpus]|uniref:uncharacterized protein LOC130621383 n=1 Tax=Hydractinia symbiolongicarpus TaxID=13093 RepID=UPI00254D4A61|nr:uncharacterized protein LOC130621383 [Hydractinia symbiolongicarpus]XP_057292654.1 uncharacterized protein LOC130621385 [Hydractinia symbiolongicarpus]
MRGENSFEIKQVIKGYHLLSQPPMNKNSPASKNDFTLVFFPSMCSITTKTENQFDDLSTYEDDKESVTDTSRENSMLMQSQTSQDSLETLDDKNIPSDLLEDENASPEGNVKEDMNGYKEKLGEETMGQKEKEKSLASINSRANNKNIYSEVDQSRKNRRKPFNRKFGHKTRKLRQGSINPVGVTAPNIYCSIYLKQTHQLLVEGQEKIKNLSTFIYRKPLPQKYDKFLFSLHANISAIFYFVHLGVANPSIIKASAFASSSHQYSIRGPVFQASNARLNHREKLNVTAGAWCANIYVSGIHWISVDLGQIYTVNKIAVQSRDSAIAFIRNFKLKYSINQYDFQYYKLHGNVKIFSGNRRVNQVVYRKFEHAIQARVIRLEVVKYYGRPCLRFELYGCINTSLTTTPTESGPTTVTGGVKRSTQTTKGILVCYVRLFVCLSARNVY